MADHNPKEVLGGLSSENIKNVESSLTSLSGVASDMFTTIGNACTGATSILDGFGKSTDSTNDKIMKLSEITGLSVTAIESSVGALTAWEVAMKAATAIATVFKAIQTGGVWELMAVGIATCAAALTAYAISMDTQIVLKMPIISLIH